MASSKRTVGRWPILSRDVADRAADARERARAPLGPTISTDHLNEVAITTVDRPRNVIDQRHAAERAPADLAEAQVGLVARCTVCGKPVTGRDVPRDRQGRPRHHRCP